MPGAAAEPHPAATTAAGADEVVAEANTAAASVDVAALAAAPPSRCACAFSFAFGRYTLRRLAKA